jgi:hypothetical protein
MYVYNPFGTAPEDFDRETAPSRIGRRIRAIRTGRRYFHRVNWVKRLVLMQIAYSNMRMVPEILNLTL